MVAKIAQAHSFFFLCARSQMNKRKTQKVKHLQQPKLLNQKLHQEEVSLNKTTASI
jgi:hypothetical protein